MRRIPAAPDLDDATVAAPEAAAHHLLERDLGPPAVARREIRDGAHHGGRAARVEGERRGALMRRERLAEWFGDKAVMTAAAVLGCEHEVRAEALEDIEKEQILLPPAPVEERRLDSARLKRGRQRRERRQADAAGHHPRGVGWIDDGE